MFSSKSTAPAIPVENRQRNRLLALELRMLFDGAAPVVVDNAVETRAGKEDTALQITGISVTDAENDSQTVTLASTNGRITLNTTNGLSITGNGTDNVTFSGTLSQINAALNGMSYLGAQDFNGAASFTLTTNDGTSTASSVIGVNLSPVNDAPTFGGGSLTIGEGGELSFDGAVNDPSGNGFTAPQLGLTEVDNTQEQVIFKITGLAAQGKLMLDGKQLVVGSTFSADQLGLLKYVHDGSQVTDPAGFLDGFTVNVDDGAGGLLVDQRIDIRVTPVNQAPVVSGAITVIEGETGVSLTQNGILLPGQIDSNRGRIDVVDGDQTGNYTYRLASLPMHGKLFYDGQEITDLSFTFTDLTRLTYSHDGSEPTTPGQAYTFDSFDLIVIDDGGGTGVPATTTETIRLDILANNNDPVLEHSITQTLNNGATGITVTRDMLLVSDVDSLAATITYTATGVPNENLGYFMRGSQRLGVGSTFTQADIDAGNITYVARQLSGTERTDTLSFTVKDGNRRFYPTPREGGIYENDDATLAVNTFSVVVPPNTGSGEHALPPLPPLSTGPQFDGNPSLNLLEGGSFVITNGQLSVSHNDATISPDELTYRLLTLPSSGTLMLNGVALSQYGTFTQADVDNGRLSFVHAGGEDFVDSFQFDISDGDKVTAAQTFNISATPQNDTPTASLGDKIPAVAEGNTVVINTDHIVLSDADREADGGGAPYANTNAVRFQIQGNVSHGQLYLNGVAIGVGSFVTAAQLSAGLLTYTHDGTESFTDSFTLVPIDDQGVTDGASTPTNGTSTGAPLQVNIIINPLNDAPVYAGKVEATGPNAIYEGGSTIIHGSAQGDGSPYLEFTDADNSNVQRQYRVTEAPAYGKLMRGGVVLGVGSVFTQQDLNNGTVRYVHDGGETRSDSFKYVVSDGDWNANDSGSAAQGDPITASTFQIEIKPVNDKPVVQAPSGPIHVDSADAANNPVPGFTVDDTSDLGDGTDFVQVTVRLLDRNGQALGAGDYTAGGNTLIQVDLNGAAIVGAHDGVGDYLVIQGTQAQVNAALASLRVQFPDGRNEVYSVQVIVDDRLRDGTGTLVGGANGGDKNQPPSAGGVPTDIPTDEIDPYATAIAAALSKNVSAASVRLYVSQTNEAPAAAAPAAKDVYEDVPTFIGGEFVVVDDESTALGLPVTVTLEVLDGQGRLGIGGSGVQTTISINGRSVEISGDGTGTLVLTGRADDIQALLNDPTAGLTYTSLLNANADANGTSLGDVTVRMTLSEGSAAVGGDTGSGSQANPDVVRDIAVTITPTNDAPTANAGSGTIVLDRPDVKHPVTGVQVGDPDTTDGISDGESAQVQVTIRLVDDAGNPLPNAAAYAGIVIDSASDPATAGNLTIDGTYDGNGNALVIRGALSEVNAFLSGLRIEFSGSGATSNADRSYTLEVIVDDRARDLGTGALDGSGRAGGGVNLDNGQPTGVSDVPTTAVDPYADLAAGLTQNVAVASRQIFVSGVNDPAHIDANDVVVNETNGVVSLNDVLGDITVTDADSIGPDGNPASNLSATVTITKGVFTSAGDASLGGTVSGVGTMQITITGATLAQLNARLQALQISVPGDQGPGGAVDWNGQFQLTVVVNDGGNSGQRPGSLPGDTDNPGANPGDFDYADGTSAELLTTRVINVTVNPVNDAPTRNDALPVTLAPVAEDTSAGIPGATVQDLFESKFNDARDTVTNGSSANGFAGVAITQNLASAGQGTWQYSVDGGANWIALPAVSDTNALLLGPSDMLRFVPAADFTGTPGSLQGRLVDDSGGALTGGTTVNVAGANSGGTTRYSDINNTVTLETSVTPVNDAPTLSGPGTIVVREDVAPASNGGGTIGTILAPHYSDGTDDQTGVAGGTNNAASLQGIVVLGNTADPDTQGKWQYSVSPGVWVDVPRGTDLGVNGNAIFLPQSAALRFQPVADYNGAAPALVISAVDGSAGARTSVETGITLTTLGGDTQYSAAGTLGGTVTAVNDAPQFSGLDSNNPVATKGGAAVRLDADGAVSVSDVELSAGPNGWQHATLTVQRNGGASADDVFGWATGSGVTTAGSNLLLDGVVIGTVAGGTGTLTVTFSGAADNAAVARVMGAVTYRNVGAAGAAHADVQIGFTLNDQNSNAAGGGAAGSGQDQGEEGAKSVTHTVTVQINTPPAGAGLPDRAGVDSQGIVIETAGGFTDVDADTLTYSASGLPAGLSIDAATGRITGTFTPSASQSGTGGVYTITITATDENGAAVSQHFDLTVTNPAPVAQADLGATDAQTPISGNVIVGALPAQADSDPDGDSLVVSQINGAATSVGVPITGSGGGRFVLNGDGSYSFDPNGDFGDLQPGGTRTTSITYQISDGEGGTASTTLTITVQGQNDAPTTVGTLPDRIGVDDTAMVIDTASGFTDVDVGDALSYSATGLPPGLAIDPATGQITGTLDPSASQGGAHGVYTVTVTATDMAGATALQTFTVTVSNPPPVAQPDSGATDANTAVSGNVITGALPPQADNDPDGDTLTVTQVNGSASGVGQPVVGDHGGRFTINPDGTYSFDPAGDFADLRPGQTRMTSITYQVSDGEGGTDETTLTITVTGLNDPPVALPDTGQTDALTGTSGNVMLGGGGSQADSDPDGDPITVVAINGQSSLLGQPVAGSNGGVFVLNPDGTYSFNPDGDFTSLAHGQTATTQITYAVSDGIGGTATTTLTITVVGTNDAPSIIGAPPDRADIDARTDVSVDLSTVFGDVDGDKLTYTGANLPPGLTLDPSTGRVSGTVHGSASQGGNDGAYTVTITATDEHGSSVSQSFVWRITNPPPVAEHDSGTTPSGVPLNGNVLENDSDPDGDPLTVRDFSVQGVDRTYAAGETAVIAGVGTIVLNADGSYTFTPAADYFGAVPLIDYTVTDGEGGSASATLRIVVTEVNRVQPLPADAATGGAPPRGALAQSLEERRYGIDDTAGYGDVLRVEYWWIRPELYYLSREADPGLFVTYPVRASQVEAQWPHEPATIESETINLNLAMRPDMHVLAAVQHSQTLASAQDRAIDSAQAPSMPGASVLFDDFDPFGQLDAPAPARPSDGAASEPALPPATAPSFSQQLSDAAKKVYAAILPHA